MSKVKKNTRSRRKSQKGNKMIRCIMWFLTLVVVALGGWYFSDCVAIDEVAKKIRLTSSSHELLMVAKENSQSKEIVNYEGMTLSFNKDLHIPNWVSWELTATEVAGAFPRKDNFRSDDNVAGSAEKWDYSYSGYDRGHMAPAGDMKWSEKAMDESFYMTNMCPQAKTLNTGAWKRLEEKCRQWAEIDSAIIIVCGPILTDPIEEFIGDSRVAVPQRFFKVILSPYVESPRGIGFIMPNGKVTGGMQASAASIDEVERITGLDFFSSLPDEIENEVESQCRFHYWSTLKKKK